MPINPYDGMPTYIISYDYSALKMMKAQTRFLSDSFSNLSPMES